MKLASKNRSDGSMRLRELVVFTVDLMSRCSSKGRKNVARHCCTSLGALGWFAKDDLLLVKKIADSLLNMMESLTCRSEVLHEGLIALVALCKDCMEICCISCKPNLLISLLDG
ncbi:unnamed protein product [Polarella glacialis]|uniref:Uncharacterized protein n=1 Tax=Polarella glacialis TaxID=89957 RepID=A0A813DUM9_POLGL|nr:unnamed protein product [Polarella glacialis]